MLPAAQEQLQLKVYGEVLDLAWQWHARGHSSDPDYWEYLTALLNRTCAQWREKDHGIWEMPVARAISSSPKSCAG